MLENTPHLRLEIIHNIFVLHIEHCARQHSMPVVHESLVLGVKLRQFELIVSKGLTTGEHLLEAAEAAVQRMAPGIDDFYVGQNEAQETNVCEIIRQFVRKARQVRLAMSLRAAEVLFT